jgi:hypothetical protein
MMSSVTPAAGGRAAACWDWREEAGWMVQLDALGIIGAMLMAILLIH